VIHQVRIDEPCELLKLFGDVTVTDRWIQIARGMVMDGYKARGIGKQYELEDFLEIDMHPIGATRGYLRYAHYSICTSEQHDPKELLMADALGVYKGLHGHVNLF